MLQRVLSFKQPKQLKPYIECNRQFQKQEEKKITKSKEKKKIKRQCYIWWSNRKLKNTSSEKLY